MGKGKGKAKRRNKSRRNSVKPRRIPDHTPPKPFGSEPEPEPPVVVVDPIDPDACDRLSVHRQLNAPKRSRPMKTPNKLSSSEEEETSDSESSSSSEEEEMELLEVVYPASEVYRKFPENKYGKSSCKCCQKLQKRGGGFKEKDDDNDYVYSDDEDFGNDVELKLRLIHHRRKRWVTGSFYADCQPANPPCYGGIYHREHFWEWVNLDKAIEASVRFVLKRYEKQTGESLVLKEILNTTAQIHSRWYFYVTFTAYQESDESNVQIYHTVVTNNRLSIGGHKVEIFRRKIIGQVEYEDLLPPYDENMDIGTRVKKELIHTLDEEDREAFELERRLC